MAQKINGQCSLVASLTQAIKRNITAASEAADRIMAGTATAQDLRRLRAGEKSIALLMGKAVS